MHTPGHAKSAKRAVCALAAPVWTPPRISLSTGLPAPSRRNSRPLRPQRAPQARNSVRGTGWGPNQPPRCVKPAPRAPVRCTNVPRFRSQDPARAPANDATAAVHPQHAPHTTSRPGIHYGEREWTCRGRLARRCASKVSDRPAYECPVLAPGPLRRPAEHPPRRATPPPALGPARNAPAGR